MDPITTVSLVAIIVQLVDFSCKVLSNSTEFYRSAGGVLIENAHIETTVTDLSKLNTRLKQSSAAGDTELQTLCEACNDVADQLLITLSKVKVNGKGQRWQSFRKALRSIWSKDKIQQLEQRLASFRSQLNLRIATGMRYVFALYF
jgi:urease accessory protein UreF